MHTSRPSTSEAPSRGSARRRTAADVAVVLVPLALVIAIAAHAPSHLYAYAQLRRIGSAISMLQGGDWLLPVNQTGDIASKPVLYPWLTAACLKLTGLYHDFVFRLPTIAAAAVTVVLVYLLGRRWYGRRAGVLAGCLWATCLHMGRMAYLAATDMLLAASVAGAMLCADRLLFHRAARRRRGRWAVGLWGCMVLGALAKGWGVVNLALVGGALALACGLVGGFGAAGRVDGAGAKAAVAGRLLGRRLWRAMRATRFGWGMLAMAAVLVPLWVAMFVRGGEAFRQLVYFEFIQRATGSGAGAPKAPSAPPVLHLVYSLLPASVFALGAVALALEDSKERGPRAGPLDGRTIRRAIAWLARPMVSRKSPIRLPLCWVVAVVVPFSLAHGFRPDYLLPCYAAAALMGAWAVEALAGRGRSAGRVGQTLRHVFAAAAIALSLAVSAIALAQTLRARLPASWRASIEVPAVVAPETWFITHVLAAAGLGAAALAVVWSLKWRLRQVAAVAMAAMVGLIFLHAHLVSRHARTGDGETMIRFARAARPIVRDDEIAVHRAAKVVAELYLGRLGTRTGSVEEINATTLPWLVTCDRGLAELGAARPDPRGAYTMRIRARTDRGVRKRKLHLRTLPEELGDVHVTSAAVQSQNWGRIYLIRLKRPVAVSGPLLRSVWESGRRDDEDED